MTASVCCASNALVEMNTLTLTGPALDWAMAMAVGLPVSILPPHYGTGPRVFAAKGSAATRQFRFAPSTDWGQAGAYIEKYGFTFTKFEDGMEAEADGMYAVGPDHLAAMCRAVVSGWAGLRIQVPVELLA